MQVDLTKIPVYYINLNEQPDRARQTETVLRELGFNDVTRIPAIKHEVGMVGCALSHHKVMADKSIKAPFILMEDDVLPTGIKQLKYDVPDNSDALYLGNSQWARFLNFSGPYLHYHRIDDRVVQVYNMLAAHAVVYFNETYRNHLARVAEYSANIAKFHMDVGYAESHRYYNVMALDTPIFMQGGYNLAVTNVKVSEVGKEVEGSQPYFDQVKFDLNQLTKVVDRNNCPPHYNPLWWISE